MDDFADWFYERIIDIKDWFTDNIRNGAELLLDIVSMIIAGAIVVISFPIWIIFFIYWIIFVRNKD